MSNCDSQKEEAKLIISNLKWYDLDLKDNMTIIEIQYVIHQIKSDMKRAEGLIHNKR